LAYQKLVVPCRGTMGAGDAATALKQRATDTTAANDLMKAMVFPVWDHADLSWAVD
jgi:hypothetical protein